MFKSLFCLASMSEFMAKWFQFLQSHLLTIWILATIFVVAGIVASGWIVVTIPSDYFVHRRPLSAKWRRLPPLARAIVTLSRNMVGLAFVLLGMLLALPLIPGPGLLIFLLGLGLMDFPGKWQIERWLVQLPKVFETLNRIRKRKGCEPLIHPKSTEAKHTQA